MPRKRYTEHYGTGLLKTYVIVGGAAYGLYYVGRVGYLGPVFQQSMWNVHRAFMGLFGVYVPPAPPVGGGY